MDFFTAFCFIEGALVVGGLLGYYIGKRGVSGIENDIGDIKTDIATLKGKISPVSVVSSVPVANIPPVTPVAVVA